jgi:hypothetical protein
MNFNTCVCPQLLSGAFQLPKEPIVLYAENTTPGNLPIAPERRQRATQEQSVRDIPEIKLALLTEQELAERWRMSIRTLQGWRQRKTGPNFIKIRGQAVRYPMGDVLDYEAQWK